MNLTSLRLFATGVRITRLIQAVAFLSLAKLAALGLLWLPQSTTSESPLLQPVIVRQSIATGLALAAETPAEETPLDNNQTAVDPQDPLQVLNARQQALDKREAELRALETELDGKLEKLRNLELKMQGMIDSAENLQDEKMQHLVDVYSNMKPKQAAQVLETLDESIAVRILAGMSGRKAGEVLSSVRADRAAKLSEALTRLQVDPNGQ